MVRFGAVPNQEYCPGVSDDDVTLLGYELYVTERVGLFAVALPELNFFHPKLSVSLVAANRIPRLPADPFAKS